MIQESGQILGLNRAQSNAVQSVLTSKGYTWEGNYLSEPMLDTPNVYWYENKRLMLVPPMSGDLAPHTLAEFGLNDQGEPLSTFGNLKPGDPNPFVVGMEVITPKGKGNVLMSHDGPYIEIFLNEIDQVLPCGFYTSGHLYGRVSINTIYPVKPASHPEKTRFEFGDKVKVGKRMYRFLCYTQDGLALVCSDHEFDHATLGPYDVSARSVMAEDVTPWPTPTTIPLNDNHNATVTPDGITVGCQTFPLSVIDALVEARKKMQA